MTNTTSATLEAVSDGTRAYASLQRAPAMEEIFGRRPVPEPWRSPRAVLKIATDLLPTIEDDLTADLVIHLAYAIADLLEQLTAVRTVQSASLELSNADRTEILRLDTRLANVINELRRVRATEP